MYELNFESFFPVLDCKIRYINVPGALGGPLCVDHLDGSHVIFEEFGSVNSGSVARAKRRKFKLKNYTYLVTLEIV